MNIENIFRAAAVICIMTASSCAVTNSGDTISSDPAVNHPIAVEPSFREIKLGYGGPDGMSTDDGIKFDAFLAEYRAHGNGSLGISVPSGASSRTATTFFAERAASTGIPRDKILVSTHDVANGDQRVDVSFITYVARAGECGDWSENMSFTAENHDGEKPRLLDLAATWPPWSPIRAICWARAASIRPMPIAPPPIDHQLRAGHAHGGAEDQRAVGQRLAKSAISKDIAYGQTAPQWRLLGAAPHERPVPRISIHAFANFPIPGRAAARGRRSPSEQGASAECSWAASTPPSITYRGQITPNLLIVETKLSGEEALNELDRLAEVCDPTTKVIVVGRANDVELYRELMRRGAREYLVAPLSPLQLIEVISGLVSGSRRLADRPRRGRGRRPWWRRLLDPRP